jgi:hypothetical protein
MKLQSETPHTQHTNGITAIDPQTHELCANLNFTAHDLNPHYALDSLIKQYDGATTDTICFDNDRYEVTVSYSKSGLQPWDNPEFELETVREFDIKIIPIAEDNRRKVTLQVSPRWPNQKSKGDSPNPSNPDFVGINVKTQGSNFSLDSYIPLLQTVFDNFGLNQQYVSSNSLNEGSTIYRYERYVRLDRDKAKRLTDPDGLIDQIMTYCRTHGDKGERTWDNEGVRGYYGKVKFDSKAAESLISGHTHGKQIKHYHPKHVRDNPSDPLYHPKVGIALIEDTIAWTDRHDLITEIDELLINSLSWSGIETTAGDSFVADDHFDNTDTTHEIELLQNPLDKIKQTQQSFVDRLSVKPDLNKSDRQVLEKRSEGKDTVSKIVDNAEFTERTVYRAIDRIEVLMLDNGRVEFASEYVQSAISELMSKAKSTIESVSKSTSPFQEWANAHGVDVSEKDERLIMRFGEVSRDLDNRIREVLRTAKLAWTKSGKEKRKFKWGRVEWTVNNQQNIKEPIFR